MKEILSEIIYLLRTILERVKVPIILIFWSSTEMNSIDSMDMNRGYTVWSWNNGKAMRCATFKENEQYMCVVRYCVIADVYAHARW